MESAASRINGSLPGIMRRPAKHESGQELGAREWPAGRHVRPPRNRQTVTSPRVMDTLAATRAACSASAAAAQARAGDGDAEHAAGARRRPHGDLAAERGHDPVADGEAEAGPEPHRLGGE